MVTKNCPKMCTAALFIVAKKNPTETAMSTDDEQIKKIWLAIQQNICPLTADKCYHTTQVKEVTKCHALYVSVHRNVQNTKIHRNRKISDCGRLGNRENSDSWSEQGFFVGEKRVL